MLLLATLLQAACPAVAAPPPELAGWAKKTPIVASAQSDRAVALPLGQAVTATLRPAGAVTLPATPGKPAAAGSSSGVMTFTVPAAGRYRIALSKPAWLDVVAGKTALTSVTHGHGPACTGIRKTVDFDLKAGRHFLQVVGSPEPTVDVMVARLR